MSLQIGQRIVVRTPDRRSYGGRLLELRNTDSRTTALVRLDTGWETAFPVAMVHPSEDVPGASDDRNPEP